MGQIYESKGYEPMLSGSFSSAAKAYIKSNHDFAGAYASGSTWVVANLTVVSDETTHWNRIIEYSYDIHREDGDNFYTYLESGTIRVLQNKHLKP